MSVWTTIAEDFHWKPLGREAGNPYPCGSILGWTSPASLLPDESRYQDVGCVCHTDMERALILWRRKIVQELLGRAAKISREEGMPVRVLDARGREEWSSEGLSDRIIPILRELEASRESMELLMLRMNLLRRLSDMGEVPSRDERHQRFEEIDRPAPLAGPVTWSDKTYNPR
jgi:hypothetical protein